MQTSLVNILIALAGIAVTLILGTLSQSRLAKTDYVKDMETALKERIVALKESLANETEARSECVTKLAACEAQISQIRAENIDLLRRLVRLENGTR